MSHTRRVSITEYAEASLVSYNLGGVDLLLNLPPHQELSKVQLYLAPSRIDIFDNSAYKGGPPPEKVYLPLVKTAWLCTLAGSVYDAGSMILIIEVLKNNPDEHYDFLDEASFANWMLNGLRVVFEELDRPNIEYLTENNLPITDQDFSVYPKQRSELIKISKGGMFGYLYYTGHPGIDGLDATIRIPINKDYALAIIIRFGGFNSNFFSSEAEIIAEKDGLLYEFLDNVRLTYPAEILEQIKIAG